MTTSHSTRPACRLFWLALTVLAAVLVAYWASLKVAYTKGALAMHPWFFLSGPRSNFELLKTLIVSPEKWDISRPIAMLIGGAFTYLLIKMRQQFVWFPVHPIGYVVGSGFEASRMWFPFLVGWLVKSLVGRYGSVQLYRSLRAPFLGLVLGEYSAAGLWLLIDALVGRTVQTLNGLGIGRGDRVGLVLPNCPEMATAFVAVAGACTCAPNGEWSTTRQSPSSSRTRSSSSVRSSGTCEVAVRCSST